VFTGAEALEYLGVSASDRTLETLRREHGLVCFRIGQETMYHRRHLDSLIERLAGMDLPPSKEFADSALLPADGTKPVSSRIRMALRA
jgi:hypothetical protein